MNKIILGRLLASGVVAAIATLQPARQVLIRESSADAVYAFRVMIAKEKTLRTPSTDPRLAAGEAAERQMAFYLRRAFEKPLSAGLLGRQQIVVRVFNDLRLPLADVDGAEGASGDGARRDAAQIDHLVMHPWGMVIVESKSMTGEVAINGRGEWARVFRGKRSGMASPIEQARRQAAALRRVLQENRENLRDRKLLGMLQAGFLSCPVDILVAISDKGIIRREGCEVPEAVKADQIVPRIEETIERHRKGASLLSKTDAEGSGAWSLTEEEAERVTAFLLEMHEERDTRGRVAGVSPGVAGVDVRLSDDAGRAAQAAAKSDDEPVALEALTCGKCRSINVQMVHARYGYCLKCGECERFTPVDFACTACGKKAKIAKQGLEFRRVCAAAECGAERVFFRNAREA